MCKQPSENAFSQQLISWIQDALSAESFRFDYRHYVETTGWSAFRLDVMDALCQVPTGKRITYSQLAEHAGYPGVSRAVGSVMAKNPVMVLAPCHRVIRQDGGLGGYAGGLDVKKRLLALEN